MCNAEHSQSGYNVLRKMVAPLSREGRFSAVMFSGSHRQSLRELQQENADIAAIDCVTYALLQRHQPQALAGGGDRLEPGRAGAAADHRRRHPGGNAE